MIDWHFYVQASIAMFMITSLVFAILAGAALIGRQVLELLGINLDAFSVVGGLVIAGMGFDMLNGGKPTKAQGRDTAEEGPGAGRTVPTRSSRR